MILTYKLKLKDCDVIFRSDLDMGELVREEINFEGMTEDDLKNNVIAARQATIDEVEKFLTRHIKVEIE